MTPFWLMLHSDLHIRGWTISGHLNHVLSFPPLSTTKSWINYSSYIQTITISLLPMQMYFQHVIHMVKEVLTLKTSEFLTKKYLTSQISWSAGDTQQRHWCNALRIYDSLWKKWYCCNMDFENIILARLCCKCAFLRQLWKWYVIVDVFCCKFRAFSNLLLFTYCFQSIYF